MHQFRRFLIASLWLLPSLSWASENAWWCTLNPQMSGNARHFLLWGRDAWDGETVMRCQRSGEEVLQNVAIGFFSKNSGIGANSSSIFTFNITLWTQNKPDNLIVEVTGPGMVTGSTVYYQLTQDGVDIAASAWTGFEGGVAQSLSLGTLTIQPAAVKGL
jgi:hypothetical protein